MKFIRLALEVASKSPNMNFMHGCVIIHGGKPLITACNKQSVHCHAEAEAVRKLCEIPGTR